MRVIDRTTVEELLDRDELVAAVADAMADLSLGRASVPPRIAARVDQSRLLATMPAYSETPRDHGRGRRHGRADGRVFGVVGALARSTGVQRARRSRHGAPGARSRSLRGADAAVRGDPAGRAESCEGRGVGRRFGRRRPARSRMRPRRGHRRRRCRVRGDERDRTAAAPGERATRNAHRIRRLPAERGRGRGRPAARVPDRGRTPGDRAAAVPGLVAGSRPGRRDDEQVTVYKSVGVAVQDAAAAAVVLSAATRAGAGVEVAL
jgi:hypothetical protein